MNEYIAFYKDNEMILTADSSYEAQTIANQTFKAKKQYDVTVMLIKKNAVEVIHNGSEL